MLITACGHIEYDSPRNSLRTSSTSAAETPAGMLIKMAQQKWRKVSEIFGRIPSLLSRPPLLIILAPLPNLPVQVSRVVTPFSTAIIDRPDLHETDGFSARKSCVEKRMRISERVRRPSKGPLFACLTRDDFSRQVLRHQACRSRGRVVLPGVVGSPMSTLLHRIS
jgi:hypothetical protein